MRQPAHRPAPQVNALCPFCRIYKANTTRRGSGTSASSMQHAICNMPYAQVISDKCSCILCFLCVFYFHIFLLSIIKIKINQKNINHVRSVFTFHQLLKVAHCLAWNISGWRLWHSVMISVYQTSHDSIRNGTRNATRLA